MLGRYNYIVNDTAVRDKLHLLDHLIGGVVSIIGSSSTASLLFVDLAMKVSGKISLDLSILIGVSVIILIIGFIYQAWHFEKEETPEHAFYHWITRKGGRRELDK